MEPSRREPAPAPPERYGAPTKHSTCSQTPSPVVAFSTFSLAALLLPLVAITGSTCDGWAEGDPEQATRHLLGSTTRDGCNGDSGECVGGGTGRSQEIQNPMPDESPWLCCCRGSVPSSQGGGLCICACRWGRQRRQQHPQGWLLGGVESLPPPGGWKSSVPLVSGGKVVCRWEQWLGLRG